MSCKKNIHEAYRWMATSLDDESSALILQDHSKFAHACFHAQQAGEKALKALWYYNDADPWGHSLKNLIGDLKEVDESLFDACQTITREALVLDRYYIPTRYPNGLPEITPDVAFDATDAAICIEHAQKVIALVTSLINYDKDHEKKK
jgi:HEPN domain-containing protein